MMSSVVESMQWRLLGGGNTCNTDVLTIMLRFDRCPDCNYPSFYRLHFLDQVLHMRVSSKMPSVPSSKASPRLTFSGSHSRPPS